MSTDVWARFEQDPRSPQAARLRASDRDRDVALDVLGQAFAEGRLDHEEYDDRATAVTSAKLLGEVVPHLEDLVPDSAIVARARTAPDLHEQAVRKWASDRREAMLGFLGVSAVTWTIWAVTMFGEFAWPVFPMTFALMNLARTQLNKRDIIEEHERKLVKREARALEARKAKELERGSDD